MRRLVMLALALAVVVSLVGSSALAADRLQTQLQTQDRIYQQDQTCQEDCVPDYPNCDGTCPQDQLRQQDQDRLGWDDLLDWLFW